MAEVADNRVAVYIDFDNIVISLYNQLHGRGAFQADRVRNVVTDSPSADLAVVERINAATVDIGAILDYASSFGTVVISRAYADWSQPVNAGYRRQLIDRAIDLTQMFPLSATKNGADIRLAIDVVEDMFRLNDVTHVVLVAGDSDYVALAQRVKRLGRYIVAVGVAGATSKSLPAACNEFSLYDDLPGIWVDEDEAEPAEAPRVAPARTAVRGPAKAAAAPAQKKAPAKKAASRTVSARQPAPVEAVPADEHAGEADEPAAKLSPRAATTLLRRALELGHDKSADDEWLNMSAVKQQIKRLDPSFHEKSIGYRSFSDFVKSRSGFAEVNDSSNAVKVRLRPQTP
jgi:uncharacterized LabA/DUF88 family protein